MIVCAAPSDGWIRTIGRQLRPSFQFANMSLSGGPGVFVSVPWRAVFSDDSGCGSKQNSEHRSVYRSYLDRVPTQVRMLVPECAELLTVKQISRSGGVSCKV